MKFLFSEKLCLILPSRNVSSCKFSSVLLSQVLAQTTNQSVKVAFLMVFFMGNSTRIVRKKTAKIFLYSSITEVSSLKSLKQVQINSLILNTCLRTNTNVLKGLLEERVSMPSLLKERNRNKCRRKG